jgi:hypothetical protein
MSSFTEEEIKLNPGVRDLDGNTYAMFLINCNIFDIPDYAKHNPAIQNYNRETCAMLYIKHNSGHDVPDWMKHDPTIQDRFGYTAAMFWIEYAIGIAPPSWTHHDPKITSGGHTAAMFWIEYTRGIDPPDWTQHDPCIRDDEGNTAAMWWCMYNPNLPFASWMNHDPTIENKDGYTYEKYKQLPQEAESIHDNELHTLFKLPNYNNKTVTQDKAPVLMYMTKISKNGKKLTIELE